MTTPPACSQLGTVSGKSIEINKICMTCLPRGMAPPGPGPCVKEIWDVQCFYFSITIERLFWSRRLSACIALAKPQLQPCDTREEGNDEGGSYYAERELEGGHQTGKLVRRRWHGYDVSLPCRHSAPRIPPWMCSVISAL